jgi:hypothetical protein
VFHVIKISGLPEAISEKRDDAQGGHLQLNVTLTQEALDNIDDIVRLGARLDLGSGTFKKKIGTKGNMSEYADKKLI